MKKSFLITLITTTILSVLAFVLINVSFIFNPAYSNLTSEEKKAVSFHNQKYASIAWGDCEIVSIKKHSEDSYHFLIKIDESYCETCEESYCESNFKNGSSSYYRPINGNEFLESDYKYLESLMNDSDSNLNLNKITKAIQSDCNSIYIPAKRIMPVFFVVFFILIGIPVFIIRGIKNRKKKRLNANS